MAHSAGRRLKAQVTALVWSPGGVTAHLGAYLVASCVLLLVNVIRTPDELWFWRPLSVWGLLLALHAVVALLARRSIRLPVGQISLTSLAPIWRRLHIVIEAWSAPQLSIISRPGLILRDNPSSHPSAQTQPGPPTESWPAWSPPVAGGETWPKPSPTWTSSWPAPRSEQPSMTPGPRPIGGDTVLGGAQLANPESPSWAQLEVAATSWLASRSSNFDQTFAR